MWEKEGGRVMEETGEDYSIRTLEGSRQVKGKKFNGYENVGTEFYKRKGGWCNLKKRVST